MNVRVNINNTVLVRLTPDGVAAYVRAQRRDLGDKYCDEHPECLVPPPPDKHGWRRFQMWVFVSEVAYADRLGRPQTIVGNEMIVEDATPIPEGGKS